MNPVTETTLRFTGDWPLVAVLLAALGLSGLMLWLYRREIRLHPSRMAWLPATLRALVVFILVLALAGPVLRHITTYRQLGRVIIAVDASASMKLEDTPITTELSGTRQPAVRTGGEPSRFERAEHLLFGGATPLLKKLIETQDVELAILRGPAVQRAWWHRQNGRDVSGEMPRAFPVQADAASTSHAAANTRVRTFIECCSTEKMNARNATRCLEQPARTPPNRARKYRSTFRGRTEDLAAAFCEPNARRNDANSPRFLP